MRKIALIDWLFCISTITSDPLHAILMDVRETLIFHCSLQQFCLDVKDIKNYNTQEYPPQLFPLFANHKLFLQQNISYSLDHNCTKLFY